MEKVHIKLKKFFESKVAMVILSIIGMIIIAVIIFMAGVTVGFHKASFGRTWGEHYNENFGMMSARQNNGLGGNYFPNAHGASGKIIKIELPNIIVDGRDNIEKVISINNNTDIEEGRTDIKTSDLKVDDFIIVIGAPNDKGVIEAKLIRLIPAPEDLK